jgi:hypothetical protein
MRYQAAEPVQAAQMGRDRGRDMRDSSKCHASRQGWAP